eukprot:s2705_g8.t1
MMLQFHHYSSVSRPSVPGVSAHKAFDLMSNGCVSADWVKSCLPNDIKYEARVQPGELHRASRLAMDISRKADLRKRFPEHIQAAEVKVDLKLQLETDLLACLCPTEFRL